MFLESERSGLRLLLSNFNQRISLDLFHDLEELEEGSLRPLEYFPLTHKCQALKAVCLTLQCGLLEDSQLFGSHTDAGISTKLNVLSCCSRYQTFPSD